MSALSKAEIITNPPSNWSSFLDQMRRDYNTPPAQGIAHGLQKDAIQNGWGARTRERGWSFQFRLLRGRDGARVLTMTDSVTTGLIGNVFDYAQDLPPKFPEGEKLARFECMFDSGGTVGPGLFGRGKLLFNAASSQQLIFYDTLTINKEYRLGRRQIRGRNCEQLRRVFEGKSAYEALTEWSGGFLQPLQDAGTRISIIDPIPEVVEAINDGSFLAAIEETWWEIIQKYDARITVTNEVGETATAKVPKEFNSLPTKNRDGWRVYYKPNVPVQVGEFEFKIKHLHFLLPPSGTALRPELLGVNVNRRGMKVGALVPLPIPEEIADRFLGYVQLEPEFEDLIADTENTTHYGFASRTKATYRNLKKTVQDHLDLFMRELGYNKAGVDPNEKAKQNLEEARAELDSILGEMGVPGLGAGRESEPGVRISVRGLQFPEETNCLNLDTILEGFSYVIRNTMAKPQSLWVECFTHEGKVGKIEALLAKKNLRVNPGKEVSTEPLRLSIQKPLYQRGMKVGCTARVTDDSGNRLAQKTFYVYIEVPPEVELEQASLSLLSADWPRLKSRRVDYDQSIRNLKYQIENKTPAHMMLRVKVRTLWAAEKELIDNIADIDITLPPLESQEFSIPEVSIKRERYQEIHRGKVILRCHAVALESTKQWEKGTRLAEHNVSFFLNMDPSYGFFDEEEFFDGGSAKSRSEAAPLEGTSRTWRLRINNTHPAFLDVINDDLRQKNYLFEEMARQTVYVLLRKGDYEPIRKLAGMDAADEVDEMNPEDILGLIGYRITDRIVAKYYRG